jgi:hypothetical protein
MPTVSSPPPESPSPAAEQPVYRAVVAFQVSHQADTGFEGWQEWAVSGDIALRAMSEIHFASTALAWDLSGDLFGTNRYEPEPTNVPAFDSEIEFANAQRADIFIAMHNDGGAPSGVFALVIPGDTGSAELAQRIVDRAAECTGLPNRGVREVRMYSLEAPRNTATYRILLEMGDNVADRAFLEDPRGRAAFASAIVEVLDRFIADRYPSTSQERSQVFQPEGFAYQDPRQVLASQGHGPRPHGEWSEHVIPELSLGPPLQCITG